MKFPHATPDIAAKSARRNLASICKPKPLLQPQPEVSSLRSEAVISHLSTPASNSCVLPKPAMVTDGSTDIQRDAAIFFDEVVQRAFITRDQVDEMQLLVVPPDSSSQAASK